MVLLFITDVLKYYSCVFVVDVLASTFVSFNLTLNAIVHRPLSSILPIVIISVLVVDLEITC